MILKKFLYTIAYLIAMLLAGFAIRYFFLGELSESKIANAPIATQALFASQLSDANGKEQMFKQWQGKIVVLNFWATWCPPCREEIPQLNALYHQYENKNVVFIGVAIDSLAAVKSFIHEKTPPIDYSILVDEDNGSALASDLGNDKSILPYTIIIKADGTVTNRYFGQINNHKIMQDLAKIL